jgi:peptide/nickel transport system ATP-binding protein
MYLGRIVETGPVEQVLTAPTHPYTQALLSVVPRTSPTSTPASAPASAPAPAHRRKPVLLPGETPDPARIPGGCRFRPRCPAYADGRAEAAGVAGSCRDTSPAVIPADAVHHAACWLAPSAHN